MNKKTILMILDGWGIGPDPKVSAIEQANTPFIDSLYTKYKHSKLEASGLAVGLPEGQMGNSEVGHMNLGAGRVVYQMLVRINQAVEDGSIAEIQELQDAFKYAQDNNKKVHFMGLVSNGGVHSHINHLKGLLSAANTAGLTKEQVFVHAFTDGRDCDPMSGKDFIADVENHMANTTGQIASVVGRYYAMDRDNRWERVALAYNVMVNAKGTKVDNIQEAIQASYDEGVTDEFIKPLVNTVDGEPAAKIEEGDVVLCFNFRTDRGREISQALSQRDIPEGGMTKLNINYLTMTMYDETFEGVKVLFHKDNLTQTLGEVLEAAGKKQIRIAETEKYPHVTFFFSGGREKEFEGETRLLAPSPKVATYDLQPEMSARDIRDKIVPELQKGDADFVCLNFANADMVGHTGVFEAAVAACQAVDECAKAVVEAGLDNGYSSIVIADHGNSDVMVNADGSPNTAHTTNLVPCIFVDPDFDGEIKDGKLGDIAPTVLKIVGVDKPEDMTGDCLI
ncbi:2,3-bisphosphoglycerate-independent phosphoglycerate mutase [Flammeovirga pacifica]|uniref:2,3-bisphosphoglycerate-independent phosphoglycerate mutase n=1 Tax=Flammeovirga pacifica TaxID=915059 RepID=A0A1S1Z3A7_FLAPC|nr:2,3-bisphosphoglycerate-independent phosphoglycerate mutase [Flammeovirga pacifica]OHX67712.1 phosphoglycerate mutase (2,3-diphosphoglycerate-independent) [Flammeovirga pacifica]